MNKKTFRKIMYQGILFAVFCFSVLGKHTVVMAAEDYILGRVMTEEEIARQKAEEPEVLETLWEDESNIVLKAPKIRFFSMEENLPVSYDGRNQGVISSVKNQGNLGTCWAFAAASSAESTLRINSNLETDISERQMIYFFYRNLDDQLGNIAEDKTVFTGSGSYLNAGNSPLFTLFELASRKGLGEEKYAPYPEGEREADFVLEDSQGYDHIGYLKNAYMISIKEENNVKQAIMEYGSVIGAMNYRSSCFNYDTAAYYNSTITSCNHAVSIIGWDDTYSKDNFKTMPEQDGAWLVKNSYGEEWGDQGYFWLSYEDVALTKDTGRVYVYDVEEADDSILYQYDGAFGGETCEVESGESIAAIYQVSCTDDTKQERIKNISFALQSVQTEYSIQIYKNPEKQNPESGQPMLQEPLTGATKYAGYYTVPLEEEIILEKGEVFSIVIRLTPYEEEATRVYVDASYQNGSWVRFYSGSEEFQTFYSASGSWIDFHNAEKSVRIKAATLLEDKPILPEQEIPEQEIPKEEKEPEIVLPEEQPIITDESTQMEIRLCYHLNKGINHKSNPKVYTGNTVKLKSPKRKGYQFKGWYLNKKFKKQVKTITGEQTRTLHLYAKWKKIYVKKATICTVQKMSGKKAVVKWRKQSDADGYQVKLYTNKKLTARSCKSYIRKNNKIILNRIKTGKSYYVRVRAYRLDSAGKRVYGKWSKTRRIFF